MPRFLNKRLGALCASIVSATALATLPEHILAAETLLIRDVTLIDGTGAGPLPNASVLVSGERITLVSPTGISAPEGATVIDGSGKCLLPGLIDTHIHLRGGTVRGNVVNDRDLAIRTLHTFLYSGVTTVMDHGNDPDFIFALRDDEQAGRIVSPRLFAAGWAIHFPKEPGHNPGSAVIESREDIARKLDVALSYDPDLIKIVVEDSHTMRADLVPLLPQLLTDVVHYANQRGVAVTAHISGPEDFQQVLDAGINNLAHAPTDGVLEEENLNTISARRVPISTTATVFSNIARVADDISWFDTPLFRATLDKATLEFQTVNERERYRSSGMSELFTSLMPNMIENFRRLHAAGAVMALGSDRSFGPMSLQELESYAAAGIPLLGIVTLATRNAAIYIGQGDELGTVQRGKLADLILLRENPLDDVANFATADIVIKGGAVVDLAALDLPVNQTAGTN